MTYLFVEADADSFSNTSAVVTALPFSLAAWVFFPSAIDTSSKMVININDSSTANNYYNLAIFNTGGGSMVVAAEQRGTGGLDRSENSTVLAADTWYHVGAEFISTTSRFARRNGAAGTENTSSITTVVDRTRVGSGERSTGTFSPFDGLIDVPAVWNVTLTQGEWDALAAGAHPTLIRPDALVAFWPFDGNLTVETDPVGRFDLTKTNTPVKDSRRPAFYRPSAKILQFPPAAAPVGGRIMSSLAKHGGLAHKGGIAGKAGGLAG